MKVIIWEDNTAQNEIEGIVSIAFNDISVHGGREADFVRIMGQSGSGKTTQGRPAAVKKYPRHTVLTVGQFAKYYPDRTATREQSNGFCLRVLTGVLFKLIAVRADIMLDMAGLTPEYEEALLTALQKNNYTMRYFIMAVPKKQSDDFIAKRERETGRAVSRESAEFFNAALRPAVKLLAGRVPNADCIMWSAFERQPVYHGKMSGALPPFDAARNTTGELRYSCEELLRAKIDYISTSL